MSDQDMRIKMIAEFRQAIAEHPNCAFHWTVVPAGRDFAISRGHAGTSDLAMAFDAICEDVQQVHVYGRCENCDRLALAFLAAREAFNAAFGAGKRECVQ